MFDITLPAKTMTSREIAELTEKEHFHVMRDLRTLQKQLGNMFGGSIQTWIHPQNEREYEEFVIDKDTCLTLMLGYNAVARMKVIKRWQELEAQANQPAFNIPKTLPDALRLAADLADKVEQQRLEIRTLEPKAHAADRLAELQESICLTEAAKHLKVQRKQLVWLMTNYRWMYKRSPKSPWLAYDDKRYAGLLEHAYHSYNDSNGESHDAASLRITPKGLVKLAEMCANQGNFMDVYTQEVATRYDGKRKQLALPH